MRPFESVAFVCVLLAMALSSPLAAGFSWDAVPPDELATRVPLVQSSVDRGVEVLRRETSIDESDRKGTAAYIRTHVRYKIFDERGVEALQRIDIRYDATEEALTDIGARVIKPDGTIIELERESFFFRDILRHRYLRYRAVSFSPPALEPGVIVEYKIAMRGDVSYAGFFSLQDEFPTRRVRLLVKPPPVRGLRLLTLYHKCSPLGSKMNGDGFIEASLERVPGVADEPFAPPDERVRIWMIYFYALESPNTDEFWSTLGVSLYKESERLLKPHPAVQKVAEEIIVGAESDEERLARIDRFCRTEITNLEVGFRELPSGRMRHASRDQPPADTISERKGHAGDIRLLFVALARAAGMEARLVCCSSRGGLAFNREMIVGLTLPDKIVAVPVGGEWHFFQPDVPNLPPGSLHWTDEGETALVSDPRRPFFLTTPITPAIASQMRRTGRMELQDDGTLEGDVTIVLSGHWVTEKQEEWRNATPSRREEFITEEILERLPTAELSAFTIEAAGESNEILTLRYHLRIPGYAAVTGLRLLVPPSLFETGSTALFMADTRKQAIEFPFQGIEHDYVEIKVPEGYFVETAIQLDSVYDSSIVEYAPKAQFRPGDRTIIYERLLELKVRSADAQRYRDMRQDFEQVHEQDAKVISLRRESSNVGVNVPTDVMN